MPLANIIISTYIYSIYIRQNLLGDQKVVVGTKKSDFWSFGERPKCPRPSPRMHTGGPALGAGGPAPGASLPETSPDFVDFCRFSAPGALFRRWALVYPRNSSILH